MVIDVRAQMIPVYSRNDVLDVLEFQWVRWLPWVPSLELKPTRTMELALGTMWTWWR